MKIFILSVISICFTVSQASAAPISVPAPNSTPPQLTVGYLLEKCEDSREKDKASAQLDAAYCYGFFYGINYALAPYHDTIICAPDSVTHVKEAETFIKWAKKHPRSWNLDQLTGVVYAMGDSYPCIR